MKEKLAYIDAGNKKYPICFNLNVMEEIQNAYGTVGDWADIVEKSNTGEPKVSDLKVGLREMINEAIDIQNESSDIKQEFVSLKQVGRIITDAGITNVLSAIKNLSISSTEDKEEEQKNV